MVPTKWSENHSALIFRFRRWTGSRRCHVSRPRWWRFSTNFGVEKWGLTPPNTRGGVGVPKNADFWRFWAKKGDFWSFSGKSGQKVFKNATFCTSIAPRIKGGCPRGKNPPIYTVLNAAFSAPPPPGAPWWDTTPRRPPTASRSRPRVRLTRAAPKK